MNKSIPTIENFSLKDLKSEDIDCLGEKEINMLKIDVYKSRLIPKLLYDGIRKWGLHWIFGPIIFVFILLMGYLFISYYENTMYLVNGVGFLQDTILFVGGVALLLMLIMFKIFYDKVSQIYYNLCKNDIIDESKYTFNKFLLLTNEAELFISGKDRRKEYKYLFPKKTSAGTFGFTIIFILWGFVSILLILNPILFKDGYQSLEMWNHINHPLGFLYGSAVVILIWGYLVPIGMWHFIATVICTRKIITELETNDALKLRALAPDGAAGLRPLGELTLSMIYTVVIPMIIVVPYLLIGEFTIFILMFIAAYFVIIFIIFFLPLGTAHNVMRDAKKDELQYLSIEFNRVYEHFRKNNQIENESQREKERLTSVQYMENLGSLYRHVENMAVWPFDVGIMTKFVITILIPFCAIGVQVLIEWFFYYGG
jgi:hypothetical protein